MPNTEHSVWWYMWWIWWSVWLLIIVWYIWWSSLQTWSIDWEAYIQIDTQDILETPSELPLICQSTLTLLDCIVWDATLSGSSDSLALSYQQLVSERNVISDTQILTQTCESHYNYIANIQDELYTTVIANCLL